MKHLQEVEDRKVDEILREGKIGLSFEVLELFFKLVKEVPTDVKTEN